MFLIDQFVKNPLYQTIDWLGIKAKYIKGKSAALKFGQQKKSVTKDDEEKQKKNFSKEILSFYKIFLKFY